MISASDSLKNLFKQKSLINMQTGCTIEYNMNSMIDGITVISTATSEDYINGITNWQGGKANPFKKLFPLDSIVQPFRPMYPGVKYFIMSATDTPIGSYLPFRTLLYTGEGKNFNTVGAKPRIYYPGISTQYKYWLSPKDSNIDLTIQYLQTSETWAAASKTVGTIPTGNKAALTNKIVVKFEKFHALPANYKLTITPVVGTPIVTTVSTTTDGVITHYYNGTDWNTTSISEPASYNAPQLIKSIRLEATKNSSTGTYLGVIEVSARLVKDVSNDLVQFQINKESSASSEDILPVGLVTANSLTMDIVKYDQDSLKIKTYNRDSTSFETDVIYLIKNLEIKPHFKVYHVDGSITNSSLKYDKLEQGTFYADTWGINQYGESNIVALDGSKYLMDTVCPELLCQNAPATATIRNLLDAVGFTNYQFNITADDKSIPQINYWWTKDTDTVWDSIQLLCRDIQMNAFFDETNTLQFYSRDYIYSQNTILHTFNAEEDGTTLPDIVSFDKKQIASANHVDVKWSSPILSNYLGSSDYLWQSPESFIGAGSLKEPLTINGTEFVMDFSIADSYSQQQSLYNFNGYVLIDSEIIEYEAMGYDCVQLNGVPMSPSPWIYSSSDVNKFLALSKPGYEDPNQPSTAYFKPNGKYKIKTRGALGTIPAAHNATASKLSGWTGTVSSWDPKLPVVTASDGNYSQYNFTTKIYVSNQPTSASIQIDGGSTAPQFLVTVQKLLENGGNDGSAVVSTKTSLPLTVSGLIPGIKYKISVQPKSGSNYGNTQTIQYRVVQNQFNAAIVKNPTKPTTITSEANAYMKLTSDNINPNQFSMAYKTFTAIDIPNSTSISGAYLPVYVVNPYKSYVEDSHYIFGTSLYLDKSSTNPNQSGGLGFFVNSTGTSGYFIIIENEKSASIAKRKSTRIVKVTTEGAEILKDTQSNAANTTQIFAGESHDIDVKVKVSGQSVIINAYVDGVQITATDTNSNTSWVVPPTQQVAAVSITGTVMFDYIYGASISPEKYNSSSYVPNLYRGQFSNDIIDAAYGNIMYNANNTTDEIDTYKTKIAIEEFGTVVREIAYINQKFDSRPAFPIGWTAGLNPYAKVIGSKLSSFGAEAYILNNTSTTIPLSDGSTNSLAVFGNQLGQSGELIYSTIEGSDYSTKEPLAFQSTWIQTNDDAKNLAEWIKLKVMNKSSLVVMSVFGNPLIGIGDIVSIKNTYQGFQGTEKLIVTNVNQSFSQGLETTVTCRTI